MTLHGLIRKLQVDELVLPESSAAEMPVGAWGGHPGGPGRVTMAEQVKEEGNSPNREAGGPYRGRRDGTMTGTRVLEPYGPESSSLQCRQKATWP